MSFDLEGPWWQMQHTMRLPGAWMERAPRVDRQTLDAPHVNCVWEMLAVTDQSVLVVVRSRER